MAKTPFVFHTVSVSWGKHLPDGDYTIGRGADPRALHQRGTPRSIEPDPPVTMTNTVDVHHLDDETHEPFEQADR